MTGGTVESLAPASDSASPVQKSSDAFISLAGVSRWFGGVVAVNDISFELRSGITGLLGPNGAGKSTLINMMSGLLQPSAGTVAMRGAPVWQNPAIYRELGLVPEREAVYGFLTGMQFVLLSATLSGLSNPGEAAHEALRTVDLLDARDRRVETYSKGMKQRAKLAYALVHKPGILVLDEPFNGLDPRQRRHMMQLLRQQASEGKAILVSSHILEEVDRLSDRVLVVVAGRLAASGPPREIRRLMTDRPHAFTIQSSNDRVLASTLVADANVTRMELTSRQLMVHTTDYRAFTRALPVLAQRSGVTVYEVIPSDESLESVFAYLVEGKGV